MLGGIGEKCIGWNVELSFDEGKDFMWNYFVWS